MAASVDEHEDLHLELRAKREPPTVQLRRWIRKRLPGLSDDTRYDLQLVCTELIANAYEHGAMPGQIRIEPVTRGVRIEVDDSSRRMPILRRPPPYSRRGRGLQIIDRLATDWGVRRTPSGKTIWAELLTPLPS